MHPMDAATILTSTRARSGRTQRDLAQMTGSSQPALARVERRSADATVERLNALLRPLGAQVAALPTRLPTIATWAESFRRWLLDGDLEAVRGALVDVVDDLRSVDPDVAVALCALPPAPTGSDGVDAALAAVVHHVLDEWSLPVPRWARTTAPSPEPFFLVANPALRAEAEAGTPAAFRRRNVFVPAEYFESV